MVCGDRPKDSVSRSPATNGKAFVRFFWSVRSLYERITCALTVWGGPLVSFMPWIPMFADRRTRQTIIYSRRTDGQFFSIERSFVTRMSFYPVYVMPPLINGNGRLFSIAELIASGYASLSSSGARPRGRIDMARLFRNSPCQFSNFHSSFALSLSPLCDSDRFKSSEPRSTGRWIQRWYQHELRFILCSATSKDAGQLRRCLRIR